MVLAVYLFKILLNSIDNLIQLVDLLGLEKKRFYDQAAQRNCNQCLKNDQNNLLIWKPEEQ